MADWSVVVDGGKLFWTGTTVGEFIYLGTERLDLGFFFSKSCGEMSILEGQLAGNDGADVVFREGDISYTCILEGLLLVVIL